MLECIHEQHMGIDQCNQIARETVFWLGITSQIENNVSKCDLCQIHQTKQTRNPMISHEIPVRP